MTPETRPGWRQRGGGSRPLVGVVILNWNQAALTLRCVQHVLEQRGLPGALAILVVDNGSTHDDLAALERDLPVACTLLKNERNLGFAGGMNVGIGAAVRSGSRYVWALNNDAFPQPDCLATLVAAVERDGTLAALTPRLLNADGTAQALGGQIDWDTGNLTPVLAMPAESTGWYLTGAALFLRVAALEDKPAFDEQFFAYWEDTDLCARLLARNWRLGVAESAICIHLGSASAGTSSPLVSYLMTRNLALFMRRYRRPLAWRRVWLRSAALQIVHAVALEKRGHHAQAGAIVAGLWDGWRGVFGPPTRLALADRYTGFALRHYWGAARAMWAAAHWLSPGTWRRRGATAVTFAAVLDGHHDA